MLSERVTPSISDDDVIEYEYVHQGQQVLKAAGDEVIRGARLKGAGRVVMRKDHRRRVMMECLAQHISRMDLGAVHRSAEEFLEGYEAAATIKVKAAEDLVIEASQAQPQKVTNLPRPR